MKKQFFIFFLFLVSFMNGWSQDPLFLSLKEAENLAIQNNYQMNAKLHHLEQGYYGYQASKSYFLPKMKFQAEAIIGKGQSGHERSLNGALRVTQPLYDKGAICRLKEAEIEWEKLRLEMQQQICEMLFQVREAYYEVLLHQTHLSINQMVIQLWEQELKRQERHFELGGSILYEVNQTKVHLKEAWIDYYATQRKIRTSELKLLTVLGLSPNTLFHLIEKEIPLPPDNGQQCEAEQWKKWAFQYRPQLKQEQFSYLLSQNKVCQTKAEKFPTLSLYASAGHHYVNNGFDQQPSLGVGMNLDWTLYDPSNKQKIRQAKEGTREAASNYYQVELETEAAVYNLLNEIEQSNLAYVAAQEGAVLAEEGMRIATKKHELGMMTSFEYRDAIKSLHEAQQSVNQARFDVRNAYDRLIRHTGLDLEQQE